MPLNTFLNSNFKETDLISVSENIIRLSVIFFVHLNVVWSLMKVKID